MQFSYTSPRKPEITQSICNSTTVPLTHNLLRTQAEKIIKYEKVTPKIKIISKLNYVSI